MTVVVLGGGKGASSAMVQRLSPLGALRLLRRKRGGELQAAPEGAGWGWGDGKAPWPDAAELGIPPRALTAPGEAEDEEALLCGGDWACFAPVAGVSAPLPREGRILAMTIVFVSAAGGWGLEVGAPGAAGLGA